MESKDGETELSDYIEKIVRYRGIHDPGEEVGEIVRCEECVYAEPTTGWKDGIYQTMYKCTSKQTFHELEDVVHARDWYCADGDLV